MKLRCSLHLLSIFVVRLLNILVWVEAGTAETGKRPHTFSSRIANISHLSQSPSKCDVVKENYSAFLNQLKICGWNEAVLVTNVHTSNAALNCVMHLFSSNNIPVIRYSHTNVSTNTDFIKDALWHSYHVQGVKNIVWLDGDPNEIISIASDIFEREKRGLGAMMPHDLTLVAVSSTQELHDLEIKMRDAVFDNFALIMTDEETWSISAVYTLMWREYKRRELERVIDLDSVFLKRTGQENGCEIFPNKNYGMNGRTLLALTQEWLPYLYEEHDPETGKMRYAGFLIGIMDALAKNLNFTYELTPDADEDSNTTWTEFRYTVASGDVDLGAMVFPFNTAYYFNHSVTLPFLYYHIHGMYLNPVRAYKQNILSVFQPEVYYSMLGGLVFVILIYGFATNLLMSHNSTTDSDAMWLYSQPDSARATRHIASTSQYSSNGPQCHSNIATQCYCCERLPRKGSTQVHLESSHLPDVMLHGNTGTTTVDSEPRHKRLVNRRYEGERHLTWARTCNKEKASQRNIERNKRKVSFQEPSECQDSAIQKDNELGAPRLEQLGEFYGYGVSIFFRFFGSIFNQGSLPSPSLGSMRVLLWSWCLMLIVLNATFTGNLTADLVGDNDELPFNTYEELLENGNFRWGTVADFTAMAVFKNAEKETTLGRLYSRMMEFAMGDPEVLGNSEIQVSKITSGHYVGFIHISDLIVYSELMNISIRNIIIMKESLMTNSMGLIFPKYSALRDPFSRGIMEIMDYGIVDSLSRETESKLEVKFYQSSHGVVGVKRSRDLAYMSEPFFLCGVGVALAVVVLLVECIVAKTKVLGDRF